MTYTEKSTQLALESPVAVQVLMGAPDDIEMIPLKPKLADANMLAGLAARWPGRGLRSVGVMGLCGISPVFVMKEPLSAEQVKALGDAFVTYVKTLLGTSCSERWTALEVAELERLHSLQDPRMN